VIIRIEFHLERQAGNGCLSVFAIVRLECRNTITDQGIVIDSSAEI
jgi:hypothetical protein